MAFLLVPQGLSTHAFTQAHFGANSLSPRDRIGEDGTFDDKIETLGVEHVRYPGGSLTEYYFDISDPDATEVRNDVTGEVKEVLPYSEFMTWAEQSGISVNVVLPTRTALGEEVDANGDRYASIDEDVLRAFVRGTLDGDFGAPRIQGFEIGNEYWGSGEMSAVEYGRVASEMSRIVKDEIRAHPEHESRFEDTDVIVQMGQTYGASDIRDEYDHLSPGEQVQAISRDYGIEVEGRSPDYSQIADQMILESFDTPEEIDAVDGVVAHIYSKAPHVPWSRTWDLEEVDKADWDETFGEDLTRHVTEWNQSASSGAYDKATDYGLKNAREMLEIAETFPDNHVEAAHVWAVQQNTATDLGGDEGEEGLTVPGEMFRLMAESLPGKREVILGEETDDIEKEAEDPESGEEVHAFAGEDEMTLFAFAGENGGEMEIDISRLVDDFKSMTLTRLGVKDGTDPGDAQAEPALEELDPGEHVSEGTIGVGMKPHEILRITIEAPEYTEEMERGMEAAESREAAEEVDTDTASDPGWQDWTGRYGTDHGAPQGQENQPDEGETGDEDDATREDEPAEQEGPGEDDQVYSPPDPGQTGGADAERPDMPDVPKEEDPQVPTDPEDPDEDAVVDGDTDQDRGGMPDGSCFVATAAYADPSHPDVRDLRRLRDEHLVRWRAGRAFVRVYWVIGPRLANHVRDRPRRAAFSRALLTPIVRVTRKYLLDRA